MFSLKGETDAPIPATSSSHTSGAPRCDAQSCTVAATGDGRRTGAAARRPPGIGHTVKERLFRGVLCPRLPPSRAMASMDRSTGALTTADGDACVVAAFGSISITRSDAGNPQLQLSADGKRGTREHVGASAYR
ncbi:hypothetical protein PAMP_010001 [Pampus punctatissimus]